ncbi:MAG: hypothetical protein WBZ29_00750 [Methanocella sp.]
MAVKAIVDALRGAEGYAGGSVYSAGHEIFSENIERDYVDTVLRLLHLSASVRRVSVAARGFTVIGFSTDGYDVVLKLAGRFPATPALCIAEPEFIDSSCAPALPSKEAARIEAEAALKAFGLLDG